MSSVPDLKTLVMSRVTKKASLLCNNAAMYLILYGYILNSKAKALYYKYPPIVNADTITVVRFMNRLIEFYEPETIEVVARHFATLVDYGIAPEHAFRMVTRYHD